jgi:SAM-dependent methyltransferase
MENIDFERLELEFKDIQEDVRDIPSNLAGLKVGDFGCGSGYPTLSLMLTLNTTDCVGMDKYRNSWLLPSFDDAKRMFSNDSVAEGLLGNIQRLLKRGYWPEFKQDDVVNPDKLPTNLDLAYCRLLLRNIENGLYKNPIKGEEAVLIAINNIVNCLRPGGLFCLVEEAKKKDFTSLLKRANLTILSKRGVKHSMFNGIEIEIMVVYGINVGVNNFDSDFTVYLCKKE